MKKSILAFAIVIGASSCAPIPARQPISMQTPFSDADFTAWTGAGTATIKGQAFLKTVGGDVKTCAGEAVYLIPANAYGNEIVEMDREGNKSPSNLNPGLKQYIRKTTCDAQGNLEFDNVPVKPWYVVTEVHWGVPTGVEYAPISQQGGELLQRVETHDGENKVFLTSTDESP